MRGSFRIFTVRGIPIRVHLSFLLILPLLALVFARMVREAAGQGAAVSWLWGTGMAVALFLSVVLHELAHALYGRRHGAVVQDITLLMIGGVSQMTELPQRSRDEAVMALVGPLTSLGLGAGLWVLGLPWRGTSHVDLHFALVNLGRLNLILGAFNLIPAFPMDGGRILRATLAPRLGLGRATRVAAWLGRGLAACFALFGLLGGNLILVFIAAFVWMGAGAEAEQTELKAALEGLRVRDVMTPLARAADASAPLEAIAAEMQREGQLSVTVVDGERVLGVVSLEDLSGVPAERRLETRARELAKPVPTLGPDEPAWRGLRLLAERNLTLVPVVLDGRLVGTLSTSDVKRAMRLRSASERRRPVRAEVHA
ncbi:MAG: site-2 protease family protein [Deltaproteobacteria bacterium]|nr:site-2 protease family protein [Deltaproteobacteria bacterium]